MRPSIIKEQHGFATLMGTVFMMVVILAMLVALLKMTGSEIMDVAEHEDGIDAFFLAESAIEQASASWDKGTACEDLAGGGDISFAEGVFSIDTAVLQSDGQCLVNTTGTVNNTVRKLQADIQLGCGWTGWAVSDASSLAGFWDGSEWSSVSVGDSKLKDVQCVRKTEAWAVSENKKIYRYSGGSWTLDETVALEVYSIDCVSENECWAVGKEGKFYHWTGGSSWDVLSDSLKKQINSIDCINSDSCWAVGESGQVYRWTGGPAWNRFQTLDGDQLYSVHCTDEDDCWIVNEKGKFFRWTGDVSWIEEFQLPSEKKLYSVHCVSSDDCWALGEKDSDATIARWNGSSWSATTPGPGTAPQLDLKDVYCTTSNDCWAVGIKGNNENFVRWQGSSWEAQDASGELPDVDFGAIHITQPTALLEWSEVVQ